MGLGFADETGGPSCPFKLGRRISAGKTLGLLGFRV